MLREEGIPRLHLMPVHPQPRAVASGEEPMEDHPEMGLDAPGYLQKTLAGSVVIHAAVPDQPVQPLPQDDRALVGADELELVGRLLSRACQEAPLSAVGDLVEIPPSNRSGTAGRTARDGEAPALGKRC